jgi:transforming acidic coiled-coil-containing protein 3
VRSKAHAETLAFQASLRKAQMQIQSLEKTVEQKVGLGNPGPYKCGS